MLFLLEKCEQYIVQVIIINMGNSILIFSLVMHPTYNFVDDNNYLFSSMQNGLMKIHHDMFIRKKRNHELCL
jgi:hypothetical protein